MTYTPIAKGTTNWDVPLNAALAQLDANITSNAGAALKAANNLSDLTNTAQARANLNLTGLANALSNMTATTNPTTGSDSTQGYSIGSTWFNTSTQSMFVATSVAVGAAVWLQIPPSFVDLTSTQFVAGNKTFTGNTSFSNAGTTTPVIVSTSTANGGVNIRLFNNQTSDTAMSARVTGDSLARLNISADGKYQWSAGSGSFDTNLYRGAANVLQTDDTVRAALNLEVGSTTSLGDNGVGEIQLANATSVPTTNPTGGAVIYSANGLVNSRNSQGLVQTFSGGIAAPNVQTTVANTTTETAFATMTIPANDMVVGALYRMRAWGTFSVTGTPTLRLRSYVGATAISATGSVTVGTSGVTNRAWSVDTFFTVLSTGTSGSVMGHMTFPNSIASTSSSNPTSTTGTIEDGGAVITANTTISNTFTIQATWGTASSSNTITCYGVMAERVI